MVGGLNGDFYSLRLTDAERRKRSTSDTMRTDEASIFNSGQRDGGWTKMLVPRLNPSSQQEENHE